MFKALIQKKLREYQANNLPALFPLLFAISLLSLLRVWFDTPLAAGVSLMPMLVLVLFLGMICALTAFCGDFANQANRFLEYLPLQRSMFWLANYLCGLAVLCLAGVSLFWLDVLFFPLGAGEDSIWYDSHPYLEIRYLLPHGMAAAVSCASVLFWMYSTAVFPAAYMAGKDSQTNNANGTAALLVLGTLFFPVAVISFLGELSIVPSGLALSPILLTSGVLFSAGSYALFALVPRHTAIAKHAILGMGLFLAISAVLFGQLYVKSHAWRVLDPSLLVRVSRVSVPDLEGEPNLILAEVNSYRSGNHSVSIDVEQGAYHDLGRGLTYAVVHQNNTSRLPFVYVPNKVFPSYDASHVYFTSMSPDAQDKRSFTIPCDKLGNPEGVRWLPDRGLVVYSARSKGRNRIDLCVADSSGSLLWQFEIRGWRDFLVDPAGRVLAVAPTVTASGAASNAISLDEEKPYMLIDLDSGSVERFGLPGNVLYFAKDLRRVICLRTRIENGRQFQSYVLVELPSLEERTILSEDEFPPKEVISQVDATVPVSIAVDGGMPTPLLRVNDDFDTVLWRKQRAEGDHFSYSIILVDLDTSQQQVVVPESATPKMPVVIAKGARQAAVTIHRFTTDGDAFSYAIGSRTYLYDMPNRQSVLLADNNVPLEGAYEGRETSYAANYSPSGRRVLRFDNVWQKGLDDRPPHRLKFSAVEVFERGKPVRLHTGQRSIRGALWLDDERIIFYAETMIYVLDSAGGSPRQVFPPKGNASSE